jgi:hypothetical protein
MNPDAAKDDGSVLPAPPSFEECAAEPAVPNADFVISPLDIAVLLDWVEEHDENY